MKRAEELAPTSLLPLPSINIKRLSFVSSLVLFPSGRSVKRSFDKAFDLDCRPLASDCFGKKVDLSFAGCQCPQAVKANKAWQLELLNSKTVYMVEAIPLAAAIFWDPNFALWPRHTLNLARKLGLKTKRLKAELVNERIRQFWANRIIAKLNQLFKNNLK